MKKSSTRSIPLTVGIGLLLIVVLGITLRVSQFSHNREFWEDEALVAIEIIPRTALEVTGDLGYGINYPIGFLLVEKLSISLLGPSEMAFRLFPLLCGIISMILIVPLACAFVPRDDPDLINASAGNSLSPDGWKIVLIAVLCFCTNKHLIYYASELRPYGVEIFAVCALYLIAGLSDIKSRSSSESLVRIVAFSLFACVAVWISLTAIYVLTAIALVHAWSFYRLDKYKELRVLIVGSFLWSSNFLVHYALIKSHIIAQGIDEVMNQLSVLMSPPLPPTSIAELYRFRESIDHYFYVPGGMTYVGLAMFTFGIGCIALWSRNRELFFMLLLPAMFAIAAAALDQYPLRGRFVLFTVPALCLIIAEGIGMILRQKTSTYRYAAYLLVFLLLFQPMVHSLKVIKTPRTGPGGGSQTTQVLEYMQDHWQEGDVIYVSPDQRGTFAYYKDRYTFGDEPRIVYGKLAKDFAEGQNPVVFPTPARTPLGNLVGSGRFWTVILGDMDSATLQSTLDAAGARPAPLERFQTVDGNTLLLFSWIP